jgi:NAD(P)H-nitrite reductase large subunit
METAVSGVYACGDCAEFNGINYALWSEAVEQGKAAGINAAGEDFAYVQIIPSLTMNAFNSRVFSIGDVGSDKNSEYEVRELRKTGSYKRLYFKNGLLSGGILIGDTSGTVALIEGLEKKKSMGEMLEIFNE